MRVLHVNSYYAAGKFYKHLYERQLEAGLEIAVYTPVSQGAVKRDFDYGAYTVFSANHRRWQRLFFSWKHRTLWADLEQKLDLSAWDLCHAHSLFSNGYLAARFKQKTQKPFVVHVRSTDIDFFFARMRHLRHVGRQILAQADHLFFLSPASRDRLLENYIVKSERPALLAKSSIVPNGLDPFWLAHPGEVRRRKQEDPLLLLYVGAVNRNKNISVTLEAMDLLGRQGLNVALTVVGPVEDTQIFQRICQDPRVFYIPPQPKEKLLDIYRSHDIFVMASLRETFGLVYAEALSQALPVLYSQGQGFDGQFAAGEVGYPVHPMGAETIAYRVKDILSDYTGFSARARQAASRFDWDLLAADIQTVYDQVSAGGTAR